MIRTYDHPSKSWSPAYVIGPAHDNHGGAALTADSRGYLHIIYFPHHHAMRYRRSVRPNDAAAWEEEIQFGERCTYPTLVCGPDDTLYFTCRRSYVADKWHMELWTKPPNKDWVGPTPLIQSQYTGYSHFQESLAWGPDQKTLHLLCRIHEKTDDNGYGRIQTVGYMKSSDYGQSWTDAKGHPLTLPVNSATIEQLAIGGLDFGRVLRAGGMTTDQEGNAYLPYSLQEKGQGQAYLVRINPAGKRSQILLNDYLPKAYREWQLIMPGGVCVNERQELYIAAQLQNLQDGGASWGHPSTEVVLLRSRNKGKNFHFQILSTIDPSVPNWLPNIERPTGHHRISGRPQVIYTSGVAGGTNKDILANGVYVV